VLNNEAFNCYDYITLVADERVVWSMGEMIPTVENRSTLR
jgi:hypothetical protein